MSAWLHIPMGPNLRGWLGISKELYTGDKTENSDNLNWQEFSDFLVRHVKETPFVEENDLVDVLDELVAMDLPQVATTSMMRLWIFGQALIFAENSLSVSPPCTLKT